MMYQNNTNGLAYMTRSSMSSFYDKYTTAVFSHEYTTSFNPVIEYRE